MSRNNLIKYTQKIHNTEYKKIKKENMMIHFLGTVAMILVLSLMITGLLKLNYKDLWVSEDKKVAEPKVRTLRSC